MSDVDQVRAAVESLELLGKVPSTDVLVAHLGYRVRWDDVRARKALREAHRDGAVRHKGKGLGWEVVPRFHDDTIVPVDT